MSETKKIYGGKAYTWGIKPVVYFYVNDENDVIHGPFKRDIDPDKWGTHAVWHTDNNPADDTRPHDTTLAFLLPNESSEVHNLFGRAKLGTQDVTITVNLWLGSFSTTLERGTEFTGREAVNELSVQRYCLCDRCRSSSTPCVNTECNGGCRDGLYGYHCPKCGTIGTNLDWMCEAGISEQ